MFDWLRKKPKVDTVESLVTETTGFLTKFKDLQGRLYKMIQSKDLQVSTEEKQYKTQLDSFKKEYDNKVTVETNRHSGAMIQLEQELSELRGSLNIAEKVIGYFNDE